MLGAQKKVPFFGQENHPFMERLQENGGDILPHFYLFLQQFLSLYLECPVGPSRRQISMII